MGLAAAWPCPPPTCGQMPPPLPPGWQLVPRSDLESSGRVSGPGHRGSLPSGSQRTGESPLFQPPSPSAHRTPAQPSHSHTCTGLVQDERAPQLEPKTLLLGQKLVCGCCYHLVAPRGWRGQNGPEHHVKLTRRTPRR